jgi:hyperosmotically inducible periplasmic protein
MTTRTLPLALIALAALCLAGGCDQSSTTPRNAGANNTAPATPSADADNTGRNEVDRDLDTKTPAEDQSNASIDVRITAEIRRAIMDADTMSINAQNCKIVTDKSGVVTLRGPVDSQAEKDAIEAMAKGVAGVTSVVNELEVKAP